jgi:hypothetical protein
MQIKFKRSGGIGNISMPEFEVDSSELNASRSNKLEKLIENVRPFELKQKAMAAKKSTDAMQYELTFQDDDGRSSTIQTDDDNASEEMFNLIDWLTLEATKDLKKKLNQK